MERIKVRTFSGVVCEQEVFSISKRTKNSISGKKNNGKEIEFNPRFKSEEERERHKILMSRRHHARIVNETFSPASKYSTLTLDNENEVHTFEEAEALADLYIRRLKYSVPDAKITMYMGRGKSTHRIHFHMLSDGVPEDVIIKKWKHGGILRIENLKEHNFYNGIDYGTDYTGLANYLFDHWTPEQKGHRWKQTKNVCQPKRENPTIAKRNYTEDKPPKPPKGYMLVESKATKYGYLYFKYVKIPSKPQKRKTTC